MTGNTPKGVPGGALLAHPSAAWQNDVDRSAGPIAKPTLRIEKVHVKE